MCEMASFVVTKKRVFWSETSDSHEDIIEQFKLKEQDVRGNYTFVRTEIVPENLDYRKPIKQWKYKLDQDLRPKWYDEKEVERRCRLALKDWYKACVIPPSKTVKELTSNIKIVLGTVQEVRNGGTVQEVRNGGTVQEVWNGGTVQEVRSGGTVRTYTPLPLDILKSASAVLVDRSGKTVVCHVGKN